VSFKIQFIIGKMKQFVETFIGFAKKPTLNRNFIKGALL
jgi:hypothetical protein